ncbi:cytochrome P450 [Aspergillus vadensis CBS 113365]|uniref:Cytochrome P450 n=1 Tax=Aspergillus vadensis (strain CBS 113365 / IMI 142717 / IBT 24658) TaxID=1448311 RepID=A0A319CF73_ASPVC|nr:cytochrome P450 [Aspergillus vadensis CBS 113365]PYH67002.1 cytochrome P450 [Aspergillus vadensis CBS 113365]
MSIVIAVAFACLALLSLYLFVYQQSPSLSLPPGPKGKPVVGNLSDLPPPDTPEWQHWMKHKERYGPITSVTILGQPIIILHDAHITTELLEKHSLKYSSRPRSVFLGEMIGWNDTLAMQPYNTRFRLYRKALHQILGTKTLVSKFNSLQELEARRLLRRMLDDPGEWVQHLKTEAGAIILKIAYGYDINPHGRDHLVDLADDSMETFSAVLSQTWMVDLVPGLKYLPSWLPFSFHKKAQSWQTQLLTTIETPYRMVREQMESGIAPPSYLRNLLDTKKEKSLSAEEKFTAKWTAGSLYLAGADTTVSTLTTFILSMALNPHIQTKAQAELDTVLGPYTLPKLSDREKLPYINAIVKESLRWYPVAPMGLPHLAITHDPNIYPHPEKFDPERFLGENPQPDPSGWVFGFGRRVCPGRVLADASVFVSVGMVLSALRISLEGEGGEVRFTPGVVSHPVLDGVRVQARSQRHEGVIREV